MKYVADMHVTMTGYSLCVVSENCFFFRFHDQVNMWEALEYARIRTEGRMDISISGFTREYHDF